jgi:hypothetical protein
MHRNRAGGNQDEDSRNGGEGLRPALWARDSEPENHSQQHQSQQ